jgi:hypothetical protein
MEVIKMINEKQKVTLESIQKEFSIPATLEIKDESMVVIINGKSYVMDITIDDLTRIIEGADFSPKKMAKALLGIASKMQIESGYELVMKKEEKTYSIEELGISGLVNLQELLKYYGLEDTDENRIRIIKNALNEFESRFKRDVPHLKW